MIKWELPKDIASLKDWALYYASQGVKVFPCLERGKAPACRHGVKEATTDPEIINEWWGRNPKLNIGMATGNGLVVIDIDIDQEKGKDGQANMKKWQGDNKAFFPASAFSVTGRGGYHLLYADAAINKNRTNVIEGVDIRGDGGYIIAPPSIHTNGIAYEWKVTPWSEYGIANVNDDVISFLTGSSDSFNQVIEQETFKVSPTIGEGERNSMLYRLGCSEQARGMADETIYNTLRSENAAKCDPPLSERELEVIYKSVLQKPKGEPYRANKDGDIKPLPGFKALSPISGTDLLAKDIPPLEFIVKDILPVGMGVIIAPPKSYKSFLSIQLCVAVASGSQFLGFQANQCHSLYMDLESSERRPQARLKKVSKGADVSNIHILTALDGVSTLNNGFIDQLRGLIEANREIKLVIVDVLQKIRSTSKGKGNAYENDYLEYAPLKKLVDELEICLILIHHTAKRIDTNDFLNNASGSSGLVGSCDFIYNIVKPRESTEAKLHITGRDIMPRSLFIDFDEDTLTWNSRGEVRTIEAMRKECSYRNDPLAKTIKELLKFHRGKWEGIVKDIKDAAGVYGFNIEDDTRVLGKRLDEYKAFFEKDRIVFNRKRVTRGVAYSFKLMFYDEAEDGEQLELSVEDEEPP